MFFIDKNGKNHHYSILGDQPIPEIQLIVSDDFTGFKTFTNTVQSPSIDRSSAIILNGKQSSDFDKELKEILIAANKRIEKGNETIIEFDNNPSNSLSYIKSVNIIKNAAIGKDASGFILINDENQRSNSRSIRNNIRLIENNKRDSLNLIRKNNIWFIENRKDSLMLIHNNRVQLIENKRDSLMLIREANRAKTIKGKSSYDVIVFTIEKHTLDQEFEKIKTFFTSHNIDFTSSVKRNKEGEITKVKVKASDQNGKTTTTSYENNQGISGFRLGLKGADFFVD